jgi:hypothetical protein
MIINPYTIVAAFVAALRCAFGLAIVVLAAAALARRRERDALGAEPPSEARQHLVYLLGAVLVVLTAVGVPLYYLVLQSMVGTMQGVMCIQGVTQFGQSSIGASRHLPVLVGAILLARPAVAAAACAWYALVGVHRRTRTGPLAGRLLAGAVVLGLAGVADGGSELAYHLIPKQEETLSAGCCTRTSFDGAGAESTSFDSIEARHQREGAWSFFGLSAGLAAALCLPASCRRIAASRLSLAVCAAAVVLTAYVAVGFVETVASPRILGLPVHHCAWCLFQHAPESLAGVAGFLVGACSIGSAAAVGFFGRTAETQTWLADPVERLLFWGGLGILGAVVFAGMELWLA